MCHMYMHHWKKSQILDMEMSSIPMNFQNLVPSMDFVRIYEISRYFAYNEINIQLLWTMKNHSFNKLGPCSSPTMDFHFFSIQRK